MNSLVERIGQLSIFHAESLGTGRFGTVFPGKFTGVAEEVAIKKMKGNVHVNFDTYLKANGHQNIIGYYGTNYSMDHKFV